VRWTAKCTAGHLVADYQDPNGGEPMQGLAGTPNTGCEMRWGLGVLEGQVRLGDAISPPCVIGGIQVLSGAPSRRLAQRHSARSSRMTTGMAGLATNSAVCTARARGE